MKVRTHYDNLKVARDAPLEVIRAAYRVLSQKYHPDKNRHDSAPRIMEIINASYAILSDEKKRKEHDAWISSQEADANQNPKPVQNSDGIRNKKYSDNQSSTKNTTDQKSDDSIYKNKYDKENKPNSQTQAQLIGINYLKYAFLILAILCFMAIVYSFFPGIKNIFRKSEADIINVLNEPKESQPYIKYVDGIGVLMAATSKSIELSDIADKQSLDFYLDDDIYLNIKSIGENTAGVNLSVEWIGPAGDVIHNETRKIGADNEHLNVFKVKAENDWPIGYYRADVLLNQEVVKRLNFEIKRHGLDSFRMIGPNGETIKFPSGVSDAKVKSAIDNYINENSQQKPLTLKPWEEKYESENPKSSSVECALDPYEKKWPSRSGYVNGYRKLNTNGMSSITLDNTSGGVDAFIKLRHPNDSVTTDPIRAFFVKQGEKFTVKKLSAGRYEIRYQDLISCKSFASEEFELEEIAINESGKSGVQYTEYTLTLFKVRDGNTQMHSIPADQF